MLLEVGLECSCLSLVWSLFVDLLGFESPRLHSAESFVSCCSGSNLTTFAESSDSVSSTIFAPTWLERTRSATISTTVARRSSRARPYPKSYLSIRRAIRSLFNCSRRQATSGRFKSNSVTHRRPQPPTCTLTSPLKICRME